MYVHNHHSRLNHKPKSPATGGHGMQAIFLESGQRSIGTGVFIPRSKKPAFSPVLLPARVVQALKLNVHELGLQISPNKALNLDDDDDDDVKSCENEDKECVSVHCCVASNNLITSNSADIFLPKDWTY